MTTESQGCPAPADARRRFRRLTLVLVAILALAAAGLAAANTLQGPRLSSANVNADAVIARLEQRLVLQANQPIEPVAADGWSVTPATAAELSAQGNTVTVSFNEPLAYRTEYTVAVDVRGVFTGAEGQLEYTFTTPDVEVTSLLRDDRVGGDGVKNPDRILRNRLADSTENTTVFEAPRIQEYTELTDALAVITLDADDAPSLIYVPLNGEPPSPISLPPAAEIRALQSSRSAGLFGYILSRAGSSPNTSESSLFVFDIAGAAGAPLEILGEDGAPLSVANWAFLPGTSSLVAQSQDQQLTLLNPLSDEPPVSLGEATELMGFLPGTTELGVSGPEGDALLDVVSGTSTPLQLPEAEFEAGVASALTPGDVVLRSPDGYFQAFSASGGGSEAGAAVLTFTDRTGTREVFRPASDRASIGEFCLSPNHRMLAVEVLSGDGTPDDYPVVPGRSGSTTYFVDVSSDGNGAAAHRGVYGFMPNWCR